MSGFLLDTNVISELRKQDRADSAVRQWIRDHADAEFWLSVLVIGELRRGIEMINRRDERSAASLSTWLVSIVNDFEDRILPVTMAVTQRWARVTVPDPVPVIDGLLAATAIEHRLTLVTRNVADVERTGVTVVNPFD